MGSDYIEYKDKNVRLHDLNIWMLRHFLIRATKEKELSHFFEEIEWVGPGVFTGIELHKYVKDNKEKLNKLISSLYEAKKLIEDFGNYIPLEYLEKNVNLKSRYFTSKQAVKEYVRNIESLIVVLSEEKMPNQMKGTEGLKNEQQ